MLTEAEKRTLLYFIDCALKFRLPYSDASKQREKELTALAEKLKALHEGAP